MESLYWGRLPNDPSTGRSTERNPNISRRGLLVDVSLMILKYKLAKKLLPRC